MVRLKQAYPGEMIKKALQGLNSTMVRLKHPAWAAEQMCRLLSQFHYGSIKTLREKLIKVFFNDVSIPLWFD